MKRAPFNGSIFGLVGGGIAIATPFFMYPKVPFLVVLLGWVLLGLIGVGRYLPRKNITGVVLGLNLMAFSGILFAVEGALGFFTKIDFKTCGMNL